MSVLKEDLNDRLEELEDIAKPGADGLDSNDQITLRKLVASQNVFKDDWERLKFLERLCLLFHFTENETDAVNTFRLISQTLRTMARQSKFSESAAFLDKLLALERRLSRVIIETQSDPAAILGICFHVILSNAHTERAKNLPRKREALLQTIDTILEHRFRNRSADERITKFGEKLRKLRSDAASIPLTAEELAEHYMS